MSAHVLGRAQIAPLFAMCTIPGETPSARRRSRQARKSSSCVVRLAAAEIFRGREMRECAFELDVPAIGKRFRKRVNLGRRNAQAVHPGVDFQVKGHAARGAFREDAADFLAEDFLLARLARNFFAARSRCCTSSTRVTVGVR